MADHPNSAMDRRRFIQSTGASLATALAAPKLHAEPAPRTTTSPQPSLIRQENYWDLRQYESVKALIESGVNALEFSLLGVAVSCREGRTAKEQLRFQCGDNFLGARDEQSARTHAAMVARQPTAWRG
jgi:hypothetical protein